MSTFDPFCALPALPRSFFARDSVTVAQELLGCLLLYKTEEGVLAGRITETEAYRQDDPACHAFRGKTPRNATLFGHAGHAYVYFTYGMHHCLNTTTGKEGHGQGVLLRALEPLAGLDVMAQHRKTLLSLPFDGEKRLLPALAKQGRHLCGGPGKICQAFALNRDKNGFDLTEGESLWVAPADSLLSLTTPIVATPRIGISQGQDLLWRFYREGDLYLSRK